MKIVSETAIKEFPLLARGKVRDIYEVDAQTLLLVTTDRMSAFDVIMSEPVPYKGVILNQLTLFWMEKFASLTPNHIKAADVADFPKKLAPYQSELEGRAVLAKKAKPLPLECIVRGCLTGSAWKEYSETGLLSGRAMPKDMPEAALLEQPLFTPSSKAEAGQHDENLTLDAAKKLVGDELFDRVSALSLRLFTQAREYAKEKGILIADTKFEFGLVDNQLTLIDEVLTPDSSRFWPLADYAPGSCPPGFDKQYLRDWLLKQPWDFAPPPPALPAEVIAQTAKRYAEAFEKLTGMKLQYDYKASCSGGIPCC